MKQPMIDPKQARRMLGGLRMRPDEFGIGRLFERVPDGVVVADVDTGRIVLWNPAASAMFGYTSQEVLGQPIEILMPERYRARHAHGMDHYRETGHGSYIDSGRPMELPACTRAGEEFMIELTLSRLSHEDSGRHFVLALIRDITDRKRAEEAASKARTRVELIGLAGLAANEAASPEEAAAQILEAVCRRLDFDLGHLYLLAGPTVRLRSGHVWYQNDAERQQPFRRETEATLLEPSDGLPGRVLETGSVVWLEHLTDAASFQRASGAAASGLVSGVGVPIRVGSRIVGILEFFSVTPRTADLELSETLEQMGVQLGRAFERQWADEERRRSSRLLAEAQHIAHLGTWTWDLVTDTFEGSAELKRIYGYAADYPLSGPEVLDAIDPDDRQAALDAVRQAIDRRGTYAFEHRIRRRDGAVRILFEQGRASLDPDAATLRILGTTRDVTSRREAEKELQLLNTTLEDRVQERTAALEVANRELEAFSYSVSHDLRAPLRAIDGFSQILLEDFGEVLPEKAQEYLTLIRRSSQQMGQLIADLLRLSRVSRVELFKTPVDLSAQVRTKLAELQRLTPRENLELDVADGCKAYGDAQLLHLLVDNLLENAWKFTGQQDAPRIAFGCTRRQGETVYFVRDNGVGFDMAYIDKLFKPFSRLHKATEFDGTGIGLATAQRVASRHGGRVWAEAGVGRGATFYFTLPEDPHRDKRKGP